MPSRSQTLLVELAAILNELPGVFSTPQWGGRAYKVGRPGAGKSKLLAHVTPSGSEDGVDVSFKLEPERAREVVERYDWIEPHSFRTLAPAGWVEASLKGKRRLATAAKLLVESHGLYGKYVATTRADGKPPPRSRSKDTTHIDRVMGDLTHEGWTPKSDW